MEPIRKPFYVDPIFPLEVVYKGLRDTGNELPDHLHDLYEIVYIHEGSGTFFIDHSLYEKSPVIYFSYRAIRFIVHFRLLMNRSFLLLYFLHRHSSKPLF